MPSASLGTLVFRVFAKATVMGLLWLGACNTSDSHAPDNRGAVQGPHDAVDSPIPAPDRPAVEADSLPETEPTIGPKPDLGSLVPEDPPPAAAPSARLCSTRLSVGTSPGKGQSVAARTAAGRASDVRRLKKGFQISVDDRDYQVFGLKDSIVFDGLDPAQQHVIKVADSKGRRYTEFELRFGESLDICLRYSSFYANWRLRKHRPGVRCGKCVTREP